MLSFASICPHPPIIVPTIGSPSDLKIVSKTIEGMEKLAEKFAEAKPQTVVVISPHGPVDFNQFSIVNSPALAGHFYNFGDFKTEFVFKNDQNLIDLIEKEARKDYNPPTASSHLPKGRRAPNIPLRLVDQKELDHGTLVPLYYLSQKLPNIKIVPIAFSSLDLETHFKFGKILQSIVNSQKSKVGIVASGDLSHCLKEDGPYGFHPDGPKFDKALIESLKEKNIEKIFKLGEMFPEASECGYRSIIILLGALNGLSWQPEILSHEGPFGVGYLVANFKLKIQSEK